MSSRRTTDHFDLLPYIAILMCTLGTLLLMTLSMTAINLGPGAGEAWIPSSEGDPNPKRPVLFEWDGNLVVVQRTNEKFRIEIPLQMYLDAPSDSQEESELKERVDSGFAQLASRVLDDLERQKATEYALFAVRPSGFQTYSNFRSRLQKRGISIGKEPIGQSKPVKLAEKRGGR